MSEVIGVGFLTMILAFGFVKGLIGLNMRYSIVDLPNERNLHSIPVPNGGGMGILGAVGIALILCSIMGYELLPWPFWLGVGVFVVMGIWEDASRVPIKVRFPVQLGVSLFIVLQTGGFERLPLPEPMNVNLGVFQMPLNILWITAFMNFFNFMDGIDGLAGSMAVLGGILMATLGFGEPGFILGVLISAACLGFLFWNWHPAKIFMGETGAVVLGFIFACMPFFFKDIRPEQGVLLTALFFWFFLADAAFTLIRRILKGERFWKPHRSHLYQRLVLTGPSHSKVVAGIMGLQVIIGALAIFSWQQNYALWYTLLIAILFFGGYLMITLLREHKV